MSLARFSVQQTVFVNLLFGILLLAGVLWAQKIPIDVYPDISFNTAIVSTVWAGASADEVERLLTTKLEEEIREVDGIKNLTSFSRAGVSSVEVEWKETLSELAYEAAVNELRAAVERVGDLPGEAEETVITELSISEINNVVMVPVTDQEGAGEFVLREVARELERELERIPGVRKGTLRGDRDREIRVYVDRNLAFQYDLTLAEISSIIARNNRNVPAGSLETGGREVTVRGLGSFATPESLAATIVKQDPQGNHVRLGELANVEAGFEERFMIGRHNGAPAIIIGVSKDPEADINTLVERVRAFMTGYRERLPAGVEAFVTWDNSIFVRDRMNTMLSNLGLGIVLVMIVLWFTVGFRNALIVTIGIPFSFLSAFLLFPYFGLTINLISLVAFVMVSGMLVDHAIVIVENIYRRVEEGQEVRAAVIEGTEEVMWPVVATVATTLAAFIPALSIQGTSGEFGSILPKTVIVTLMGSLLEALVILPAHYVEWGSRKSGEAAASDAATSPFRGASDAARQKVDQWMDALRGHYLRSQSGLLRHRFLFLSSCLAALYFSCGVQQHVRVDLFPSDFNELFVAIRTPVDNSLEQTNLVMQGVEAELESMNDIVSEFSTYVGFALTADEEPVNGQNYAVAFVSFKDEPGQRVEPAYALAKVRAHLEAYQERNADQIETLLVNPPRHGPPIGKPVAIRIRIDDYETAKEIAAQVKAELATMNGVFNIEDNVPEGPLEFRMALHEDRASLYGLTFQDVADALRAANDGLVPSTFKDPRSDEDVDIRVLLREGQRAEMSDLLDVDVRTADGSLVKLGDVAKVTVGRGYQRLYHHDAERAVIVYADVDGEAATSTSVNNEMRARFADASLRTPGLSMVFGGEAQETQATLNDMFRALGIAVLAIYAILATLFRSYLQPLVVMSVLVFAFIGVSLGLYVTDGVLSMWVLYAVVGLAGIVVNDSLVLMDFVNRERERGSSADAAVAVASRHRFRPIVLTTITTIAGLLPMSLGIPSKSTVFGPFATAIVWGLSVASLLTLYVVPALYLALEDLRGAVGNRVGRSPTSPTSRVMQGVPGGD